MISSILTFSGYGIWIAVLFYNMYSNTPIVNPVINFIIIVIGSVVAIFGMYLDRRNDRKLKANDKK
jgi:hypothetical protein